MIPLKLETLLKGHIVEDSRVEYKGGWNPSDTIHTICAFANDFSNVNGGYVVIGIETARGIPALPPKGIPKEELDKTQQEIFQYCNKIEPRYIPKMEVADYKDTGTFLLYLWCSAGEYGPYQAPVEVYSNKDGEKADRTMRYWIRSGSVTTYAKKGELAELFDKFNAVPYDDRVNRAATMDCIRRGHLEDFLRDSNSSLVKIINTNPIEDILLSLEVANETDTDFMLRNIGILMFADRPDKFIPGTQIDLVWFHTPDAEGSDDFTEKTFWGPIQKQVRDALDYINTRIILKRVVKISGQAEAMSFFNYPYEALEEALVNAVFHKSYREPNPVEIRIYVDCIMIINYPGPAHWVDMDKFAKGKVRARTYRNRRIGEFFKEIELSEKQSTGITKILLALEQNGSPLPEFETDKDRNYMITTIRIRDGFEGINGRIGGGINGTNNYMDIIGENVHVIVQDNVQDIVEKYVSANKRNVRQAKILEIVHENSAITINKLAEILKVSSKTIQRDLEMLRIRKRIERIGSDIDGHWIIK